jgi:transposase
MKLTNAVRVAIKQSGLSQSEWAQRHGFSGATLHDLLRKGTCSGRTLAALQRAGVVVANKKLIDSLDAA